MRVLALALLLLPLSAQAGPIRWLKQHPKTSKLIVAGIAAGVYARGLHECRAVNVESCTGHYGAAWGSYGATVALNFALIPLSEKIGGKAGNAISYGGSAAMTGYGIWEWRGGLNKPKEKE